MKYLSTLGSRGGIGRRKGLKIRGVIWQYWPKARVSLKNACQLSALRSVFNLFDRHNFVTMPLQRYDHSRLYDIDLSDSHLSQEEIGEYLLRLEADRKQEIEKERARRAKRTNFRFCGGML